MIINLKGNKVEQLISKSKNKSMYCYLTEEPITVKLIEEETGFLVMSSCFPLYTTTLSGLMLKDKSLPTLGKCKIVVNDTSTSFYRKLDERVTLNLRIDYEGVTLVFNPSKDVSESIFLYNTDYSIEILLSEEDMDADTFNILSKASQVSDFISSQNKDITIERQMVTHMKSIVEHLISSGKLEEANVDSYLKRDYVARERATKYNPDNWSVYNFILIESYLNTVTNVN